MLAGNPIVNVPAGSTTIPGVAQSVAQVNAVSQPSQAALPQTGTVPLQVPAAQASPVVQVLPSLQFTALFACWQPIALHESVVHVLPSSQLVVVVCTQVPVALQLSAVQTLLSSQSVAVPAQLPLAQMSLVVQALPSLQALPSDLVGLLHAAALQTPAAWH